MTSLSLPRAIVFDWDNTLIDNWPAIAEAVNHTFRHYGKPEWTLEEMKIRCNRAARDSFPDWFGAEADNAMKIFYGRFEEVHHTHLEKLPSAHELLAWLKAQNIPSFIVSNKRGDYLRRQITALAWDDMFVAAAGSHDAARDKPARDPVDHVLKHGNLVADASVWFAGDTDLDMQCAVSAGCTPVFIGKPEEAKKLNIGLTFLDCQGLQTLLYNLAKTKVT